MDTPIKDFVEKYAQSKTVRLHMPGHKGARDSFSRFDITEIEGADVLYNSRGIIRKSEENASLLFGSARTVYSAEGSSLCIRAMLMLTVIKACSDGRKPTVLVGRNAHRTFLSAAILLGIKPVWLYGSDYSDIMSCRISARDCERAIEECKELPCAVYITSPDYLGNMSDIAGIAEVCRRHGILFLVDNAHGAYLHFTESPAHPLDLGTDICCDSAHKTLPVLTGGAYLHLSRNVPKWLIARAEDAMAFFASTSPSYLILSSLDSANAYIAHRYRERLAECIHRVKRLGEVLLERGYTLVGDEGLKITLRTKKFGYRGYEIADILRSDGIECEYSDPDYTVMMFTPENTRSDFKRVSCTLNGIYRRYEIFEEPPRLDRAPVYVTDARSALMSGSTVIDTEKACGRVLASLTAGCPPAVPPAVCGELLTERTVEIYKYYGIKKCFVTSDFS